MIIKNCNIFGQIKDIVISGAIIEDIVDDAGDSFDLDAQNKQVIPGLIDIHFHGALGLDTMDGELEKLSLYLAANGTTSFLPTTMTAGQTELLEVTQKDCNVSGAKILGFHLEGPFIAESRKGAQNSEDIRSVSVQEFDGYKNVKMITVAPETEGCMQFIQNVSKDCVVSLGHTDADYVTACEAFEAGAKCLTHIYNAMPAFLHRAPGPVGAAIDKNMYVQLIADGMHVAPSMVKSTYRTFGADRVCLISDSIRPAGMSDGEYVCGGLEVVLKDGIARVKDGAIAGSTATLLDCVRKCVEFGIPFKDAVKMATETPANLLRLTNKGKLEKGFDADILILNDNLTVDTVILEGSVFNR